MNHRPRHPQEPEPRFCRAVEPRVEHRLPQAQQDQLAEALAAARQAHALVHGASFTLAEAIQHQSDLRFTARQQLAQVVATASVALESLRD